MMVRSFRWAAGLVLVCGVAIAAVASAAECEGRCKDGDGNAMVVSAGDCNATTERCRAGCDLTASSGPRPYAECVSQSTGLVAQRAPVVSPGGTRTRTGGDGGAGD